MLAVIWTVFLHNKKCPYNCGPWQLYGHDSITADGGSYMDSFLTLKTGGDKTFCLAYPNVFLQKPNIGYHLMSLTHFLTHFTYKILQKNISNQAEDL